MEASDDDAVTRCKAWWSHRREENDARPPGEGLWAWRSFTERDFMAAPFLRVRNGVTATEKRRRINGSDADDFYSFWREVWFLPRCFPRETFWA